MAHTRLCIHRAVVRVLPTGFPHSDIFGSKAVCRLPETFRRLLRPSSPTSARASMIIAYRSSVSIDSTGSPGRGPHIVLNLLFYILLIAHRVEDLRNNELTRTCPDGGTCLGQDFNGLKNGECCSHAP